VVEAWSGIFISAVAPAGRFVSHSGRMVSAVFVAALPMVREYCGSDRCRGTVGSSHLYDVAGTFTGDAINIRVST
jgi:hypothetical protein